jgi:hypothetical protein
MTKIDQSRCRLTDKLFLFGQPCPIDRGNQVNVLTRLIAAGLDTKEDDEEEILEVRWHSKGSDSNG